MATLAELRTRVTRKCGNKADSGFSTIVDDNIYYATWQYLREARPQEAWSNTTFSCSSGTAKYAFVTDMSITDGMAVIMVRDDTDDVEILRGSPRDYNRQKIDNTKASNLGNPRRWTRIANELVLYSKIPDGTTRTVRMYYIIKPSDDWTTFPLNDEHRSAVEELAAGMTWSDLGDAAKVQLHMGLYRELVTIAETPEEIEDEAPEAQLVPFVDEPF